MAFQSGQDGEEITKLMHLREKRKVFEKFAAARAPSSVIWRPPHNEECRQQPILENLNRLSTNLLDDDTIMVQKLG